MTTPIQAYATLDEMRLATEDPREAEALEIALEAMRQVHYGTWGEREPTNQKEKAA